MTDALGHLDRGLLREASAVIGVDEVGRGSLAGPVVVCAAAFDAIPADPRVQDSKVLPRAVREALARELRDLASAWILVEIWVELVDRYNVLQATRLAMRSAVAAIARPGDCAVVDQVDPGPLPIRCLHPPKGDRDWFSVAAASILAKVHRDRLMTELALSNPGWGWETNVGYGTVEHRRELGLRGRSYLHRRSFCWSPVLP